MKIVIAESAGAELDAAAGYLLRQQSPRAARAVRSAIRRAIRSLGRFPGRGRHGRQPGTRELVVRGAPYIVVYVVAEDTVFVLSIRHTRQGPG